MTFNVITLVTGNNGNRPGPDLGIERRTLAALSQVATVATDTERAELAIFWANCSEWEGRRILKKTGDVTTLRQHLVAAAVLRSHARQLLAGRSGKPS